MLRREGQILCDQQARARVPRTERVVVTSSTLSRVFETLVLANNTRPSPRLGLEDIAFHGRKHTAWRAGIRLMEHALSVASVGKWQILWGMDSGADPRVWAASRDQREMAMWGDSLGAGIFSAAFSGALKLSRQGSSSVFVFGSAYRKAVACQARLSGRVILLSQRICNLGTSRNSAVSLKL